ncbi:MAG TPA: polysaccharide biosynthesis/export family protein [Caulobacteraceae bacterium]|nr:polysaccharide biosynthesis/export family protein [Caulobacteraceae bacterium]
MTARLRAFLISFLIVLMPVMGGAAFAQTPAPSPAKAQAPAQTETMGASEDYVLGPADVIEVDLLGQPDYTTKQRVAEDGSIRLPMIGVVKAANKTVGTLSDEVAQKLKSGGFYAAPIVKIDVVSFGSRYMTVLGNFNQPGLVPIDHPYRLSEIIARVGGVREGGADYVTYTPHGGKGRQINIADLAGGDAKDDPYVSPGDKLYSPPADLVYISGQVKAPGAYPITPGMTIRMALSRGGGITDQGSYKHVSLTRDGKKQPHIDLEQPVRSGDVLVVGERLF